MRRRAIAILVAAMMTLGLAGCGGIKVTENIKNRDDVSEASTEATTESTTAEVASVNDSTETTTEETATSGDGTALGMNDDSSEPINYEDLLFPTQYGEKVTYGDTPYIYARAYCYYIDYKKVRIYSVEQDQLFLGPGTEDKYPGIKKALDDYNSKHNYGVSNVDEAVLDMAKERADSYFDEGQQDFVGFYDRTKAYITRVDDQVISIMDDSEDYDGGAHGMYGYGGYVYDSQTGEEIKLSDVVSSADALKDAAIDVFTRDYFEVGMMESGSTDNLEASFDDLDSLNWTLGPTSLNLYYNPYAIGSYASGVQILRIRFADYPSLFNKGYGASDGNWAMKLENYLNNEIYEDITGDDVAEFIRVDLNSEYDEDFGESYNTNIFIQTYKEDKSLDLENASYNTEVYLVKNNDSYYIFVVGEDAETQVYPTYIYEITGGDIQDCRTEYGRISMFGDQSGHGDDYYYNIRGLLYNPNFFYKFCETYLVSTIYGFRPYTLDGDGNEVPLSDNYVYMYHHELTSKIELNVSEINEYGEVVKGITVPAGTTYYVLRSDDRTYADCQLDDGRLVRVIVLGTEFPPLVNGSSIYDAFDNVLYSD